MAPFAAMRTGRILCPWHWHEPSGLERRDLQLVDDNAAAADPYAEVRHIKVAESGHRCGETHHRATITDAQVQEMRELHEGGMGYRLIARRMGIRVTTVRKICRYERRVTVAVRVKRVRADG